MDTHSVAMPYAQPGGPKLVAVSLSNNSVYATYTFPATVHYLDSYMNDLRFDLRPNETNSTAGVAYINDSSNEGRPGFIMVDLATGESWRRLTEHPSVLRTYNDVPTYQGHPFYFRQPNVPFGHQQEGLDGIQLTPDGQYMYYSSLDGQDLYRIPTLNLRPRDTDPVAEQAASNNVTWLGQRGGEANGFEVDSNGLIYQLISTQNAIYYFNPADLQTHGFVRDSRILWPDSASIGFDGYFYMNINQLPYQPMWNNGVDLRVHPGAILRVKLPGNGTKITTLG